MDANAPHAAGAATPGCAYPEALGALLEVRPLLWYESPAEYDALRGAIFAQLPLPDAASYILAKDFVDVLWERQRMARLRTAVINSAAPTAAGRLIEPGTTEDDGRARAAVEREADGIVFGGGAERARCSSLMAARMAARRVSPEMIHLETLGEADGLLAVISRECDRIEACAHNLIKDLEGRSATFAAMARALLGRDPAGAAYRRGVH